MKTTSMTPIHPVHPDVMIEDPAWLELGFDVFYCIETTLVSAIILLGIDKFSTHIECSIMLTDDARIIPLNAEYLGEAHVTDVLSFPAQNCTPGAWENLDIIDGYLHIGDIVLARETLCRDAANLNIPVGHHLQHLLVHGTLHLLGYDHAEPVTKLQMQAKEITILAQLGIPNPYLNETAPK
jgi:probable rRNA maturation factor